MVHTQANPVEVSLPDSLATSLRREIAGFVQLLARHGIEAKIDRPNSWDNWSELEQPQRELIFTRFKAYVDLCVEADRLRLPLTDNVQMLRHALNRFGLFPAEPVEHWVENEDLVEIYNYEGIQIYRSLHFFELCNYTIADILLNEWFILYERHTAVTDVLMKDVSHAYQSNGLCPFSAPSHLMRERFAEPQGLFEITFKYLCPLFDGPESRKGLVCTQRVVVLDVETYDGEKLKFLG